MKMQNREDGFAGQRTSENLTQAGSQCTRGVHPKPQPVPSLDVKGIASRFAGGSMPQPTSFQQSYQATQASARTATRDAKAQLHTHRGSGDDFLAQHERTRRLEELALRAAEAEARDFLHRYRGSAPLSFQLLLSLSRARLGLSLTLAEREALEAAAAQPSSEGPQGSFFAHALNSLDVDTITLARARALAEAPAEGVLTPSRPESGDGGYDSDSDGEGVGMGPAPHAHSPVQAQTEEEGRERAEAEAEREAADAHRVEAARLLTLITSIVQAAGVPITLGDVSAGLAAKTGRSWGAYWEERHGPLLGFIRTHAGVHTLIKNKWLALPGMTLALPSVGGTSRPSDGPVSDMGHPTVQVPQAVPSPSYRPDEGTGALAQTHAEGQWNPFGTSNDDTPAQAGRETQGAPVWDMDAFEANRVHSQASSLHAAPQWHSDAAPFGMAAQSVPGGTIGGYVSSHATTHTTTTHTHTGSGGSVQLWIPETPPVTAGATAAAAFLARHKQEAEDEAYARALFAEETRRETAAGRRASAPAGALYANAGNSGRSAQLSVDTVGVTGALPSSTSHNQGAFARATAEKDLFSLSHGRYMSTSSHSNALIPSAAARPMGAHDVVQRFRTAPSEAVRAAGEAYTRASGYAAMSGESQHGVGAGSRGSGEWASQAGAAQVRAATTTSSSTSRRHSTYVSGMEPARQVPGPSIDDMRGQHYPSLDEEEFALRTLQRGVCEGDDALTWPDFDLLFRPLLVHGFTLIKHGRMGPPKTRRFWMSRNLGRLYWDTSRVLDALRTGERHIDMEDVMQLVDGVGTDLFRVKAARGEISEGSGRLFSLVTVSRTFDLEAASSAQRRVLVRAFNFLIRNMSSHGTVTGVGVGGAYGGYSGGRPRQSIGGGSNPRLLR